MSYDLTTDTGKVRLRINDKDALIFADAEIDFFVSEEGGWRRGAALALETIASNEALVQKVITTQDLTTDGAKLAAEFRAQAKDLRAQALSLEATATANAGAFTVVPVTYGETVTRDEFARECY